MTSRHASRIASRRNVARRCVCGERRAVGDVWGDSENDENGEIDKGAATKRRGKQHAGERAKRGRANEELCGHQACIGGRNQRSIAALSEEKLLPMKYR